MSDAIDENGRGLPETLPDDENILWQGSPKWQRLAIDAFHMRKLAVYFLAILVIQAAYTLSSGQSISEVLLAGAGLTASALTAMGLFAFIAWMMARSALYTITNKRLVMSVGAALSIDINVPFRQIDAASLKLNNDGSGDIPLKVNKEQRVSYFLMWPHTRPWRFKTPEPMLRGIESASEVAETLSQALQADSSIIIEKTSVKPVNPETNVAAEEQTHAAAVA